MTRSRNQLHDAAEQVTVAAKGLRERASELVKTPQGPADKTADLAADALSTMSNGLEAVAEGARAAGSALRDRGRDAARSLSRGERILREGGLPAAAAGTGVLARRHAGKIAVVGLGLVSWLALREMLKHRGS